MNKFAPGPWKWVQLEFSGYYHELHDADGNVVCDDGSDQGEYVPQIDVNGGNARLIAAAPELLEALEELKCELILSDVDMDYIESHFRKALDKAHAAISKARGEA